MVPAQQIVGSDRAVRATETDPVLVVDMDGTLLRTDTAHEALAGFLSAQPWRLPTTLAWLCRGKSAFRRRLAEEWPVAPACLPVNERVLDLIVTARDAGRRVVLISAAEQRQVDAVARHFGLFDEAHGVGDGGGEAKARFLVERFGSKGFDYAGDDWSDLPAWSAARRTITVGASASLRSAAERACADVQHVEASGAAGRVVHYLVALRPHQWLKNVLIFLPIVAAHKPGASAAAFVAFLTFSMTASSVYLLNDLTDLRSDRAHPRKRLRPFAAGLIRLDHGMMLAFALLGLASLIALLFLPPLFLMILAGYYLVTLAYSLHLKRKLIIDVWTLGALYTFRILAGAAAGGVPLSFWMLGFSMFLFLSLAAIKRQAELEDQIRSGRAAAGRAYRPEDLPILQGIALSAGYAAVVVLALYVDSADVTRLYESPVYLWLVCPLLLYWISRMVMVTHRGAMTDDPVVYAVTDRRSIVVFALMGLAVLAASVL